MAARACVANPAGIRLHLHPGPRRCGSRTYDPVCRAHRSLRAGLSCTLGARPVHHTGPRRRIVLVLAAWLALLLAGCAIGTSEDVAADEQAPLPAWLLTVSPQTGEQWELDQRIEVSYDVPESQSVRMSIDGTDVTDVALLGDGQLTYDVQQAPAAVELGPGEHTVTLELVRTGNASEPDAPIDAYSWTFDTP